MISNSKPAEASFASTYLTKNNYKGNGLLKQVKGRTRDKTPKNYKDSSEGEEDTDTRNVDEARPKKTEEVVNDTKNEPATDDDPLSSSDESDRSAIEAMVNLSHTSGRASENFEARSMGIEADPIQAEESQTTTNKKGKGKGTPKRPPRQGTRKSSRHGSTQVTSPKRAVDEMVNVGGDDEDELSSSFPQFTSSQNTKRRKVAVYGSSGNNRSRSNIHTSGEPKQPSSPDPLSSPPKQDVSSSSFKPPRDLPSPPLKEDAKKEGGFLVPRPVDIPTPKAKNPPSKLKYGPDENEKLKFQVPPSLIDDDDVPIHSSEPEFKHPATLPNGTNSSTSLTTSSSKNGAPIFDFNFGDDNDSPVSPLSSVGSTCSHGLSQEEKAILDSGNGKPRQAACPMCSVSVDADFLEEFSRGRRLNVRLQNQFCRSHRKRSAELEWVERGYPRIDWDSFPERIRGHFPALEKFMAIGGQSKSFFRNALESSVKSGRDARLAIEGDSMEMMSSGYYGSKGSRQM